MHESSQHLPSDKKESALSVAQLSAQLKKTLETGFSSVQVRGEISGLKVHTSGHAYFALKDETAVLDGVCWRGVFSKLSIRPEEGMDVICRGKITTYAGRSKYQIMVDQMELAGQGALLQLLEKRKKQLAEEGLFAAERKKPLPFMPRRIGVVTSPTGAVIRDILHRIEDRFPTTVMVWPVLVQGQGAAEQVAAAIAGFNAIKDPEQRPDLIIVARGGGSLEDLWAFNEEIIIRAVAASEIPLISAVGHETDVTLIDYAADRRAPTPTAAAEMAVPVRLDLLRATQDLNARVTNALLRTLQEKKTHVAALMRALPNMETRLNELTQRLDDWHERLGQSLVQYVKNQRAYLVQLQARLKHPRDNLQQQTIAFQNLSLRFQGAAKNLHTSFENRLHTQSLLLKSFSFHSTLKRGFAIVKDESGKTVEKASQTKKDQTLSVTFQDGTTDVTVTHS